MFRFIAHDFLSGTISCDQPGKKYDVNYDDEYFGKTEFFKHVEATLNIGVEQLDMMTDTYFTKLEGPNPLIRNCHEYAKAIELVERVAKRSLGAAKGAFSFEASAHDGHYFALGLVEERLECIAEVMREACSDEQEAMMSSIVVMQLRSQIDKTTGCDETMATTSASVESRKLFTEIVDVATRLNIEYRCVERVRA